MFCASDITFGVNWEFSRRRVGDYLAGWPGRWPPPPRSRRCSGPSGSALGRRTSPAANTAATTVTGCAPTSTSATAASTTTWPWRWFLLRYTNVIGSQARALRKRHFHACRAHGVFDGVIWGLIGPFGDNQAGSRGVGYLETFVSETIGRIRTDLDRFLPREFEVLVNHGYFMCGHGLDSRPGTRPPGGVGEGRWPYPRMANPDRGREALRDSHARLLHTRWLRGR